MNFQRGLLIAGNWKMNHGPKETVKFFSELNELSKTSLSDADRARITEKKLTVCIAPPFLSLAEAVTQPSQLGLFPLSIAAQNASSEKAGAFTGEVSAAMLREIGVEWAIVGHSERRQLFGETDALVRRRVGGLLNQGLTVILCIGETQTERSSGQTDVVLSHQLRKAIDAETAPFLKDRLILAYEPVWAIGTGVTATPAQAEAAHHFIREWITKNFGQELSEKAVLLYGGSVTPENVESLLACESVDGALVGGASLKPASLLSLIQSAAGMFEEDGGFNPHPLIGNA
jgi:triosephosphate isomerase